MGFKNWSGGIRGNDLERWKVVVGEHNVWNGGYGKVENIGNDNESEIATLEWTTGFFIIGKEIKELGHQDIVKSSSLDIRMVMQ